MTTAWFLGSHVAAAELEALLPDFVCIARRIEDAAPLEQGTPGLLVVDRATIDAACLGSARYPPSMALVALDGPLEDPRFDAILARPFDRRHLSLALELALLRAHDRVRTSAAELAQLTIDRAVDGFFLVDRQARFVSVNEAATRLLGYSRAELLTMTVHDIDPGFPREVWGAHWEELIQRTSFSFDSSVRHKDGADVPVELTVNHLRFQGTDYNCASMRDITDRKRAEMALRSSEQRHRRLFEEAIEGIFNTSLEGTLLDVNPAFARMLGYTSPAELVGESILSIYVDPAERERNRSVAHAEDGVCTFKLRWRKKDGAIIHVELQGSVVRNPDGGFSHYQGFARDVTDYVADEAATQFLSTGLSRHAGRALFEEAARHLAAIVEADIGFVVAFQGEGESARGHVLGMWEDGESVAPFTYALVGTPCRDVLYGGRSVLYPRGVRQAFPDDEDLRRRGIEGYASSPFLDASGQVIGHVGCMTRAPIHHVGRIESVLRPFALRLGGELERQRSEARFFGVFEFATSALFIVDEAQRIVMANRMAESMLGLARSALLGRSFPALVEPVSEPAVGVTEHWALRADGTRVTVEITTSPLTWEGQQHSVVSMRDVSARAEARMELARLEGQLRQSQRLEALGTLAGGIAHDFNNLLTAIVASVDVARDEVERERVETASVLSVLNEIDTAATRATALVQQILAFSRQTPSRPSVTAVGPIVEEVGRMLRKLLPPAIQLELELGAVPVRASVDATQLHRVLMNLGTNAGHAIGARPGTIRFRVTHRVVDGTPPVAGMPNGSWVCLSVSDDGPGIDPAIRDRVFEPFFTTKGTGGGTGLGLSVAHGIVAEHGGAMAVQSTPGAGATFTVYLPATDAAPTEGVRLPPPPKGRGRVLLVDDEPALVRVGTRLIEKLGYEVVGFVDPHEALDAFFAAPQAFDLVMTDQNMPGLTGLEVARRVHAIRPDLPVLLVSGNATVSEEAMREAGIPHRLEKPFASDELGRVLHRTLSGGDA